MEDKMVELARFQTLTEAEMLVSLLKSEGIDSYVRDAILSQNFFGNESMGLAKVELLAKDVGRAREIMREYGYEISDDSEEALEALEADDDEIYDEYEEKKARLSKVMTLIVICLLVILALIILLNKFL